MQPTGHTSWQAVSITSMHGLQMTYGMGLLRDKVIQEPTGALHLALTGPDLKGTSVPFRDLPGKVGLATMMETESRVWLRQIDYFAGLPEEDFRAVARHVHS